MRIIGVMRVCDEFADHCKETVLTAEKIPDGRKP